MGTERERLTRVAMSMLNIRREAKRALFRMCKAKVKRCFILLLFLVFYVGMGRKLGDV